MLRPFPLFQSTLPVWGATPCTGQLLHRRRYFNPRSPCGERPYSPLFSLRRLLISIHAPRVGSDFSQRLTQASTYHFNPRSPCGERLPFRSVCLLIFQFQSTLPVWGATLRLGPPQLIPGISIHAPRVGSDTKSVNLPSTNFNFNPRSPCGERHLSFRRDEDQGYFNPRSPCGERQQRCTDFSFASSAKKVLFVIFSKLGGLSAGNLLKTVGCFLSKSGANPPEKLWVLGVRV